MNDTRAAECVVNIGRQIQGLRGFCLQTVKKFTYAKPARLLRVDRSCGGMRKTSDIFPHRSHVREDVVLDDPVSTGEIDERAGFEKGREPEDYCPAMFVLSRPEDLSTEAKSKSPARTA